MKTWDSVEERRIYNNKWYAKNAKKIAKKRANSPESIARIRMQRAAKAAKVKEFKKGEIEWERRKKRRDLLDSLDLDSACKALQNEGFKKDKLIWREWRCENGYLYIIHKNFDLLQVKALIILIKNL